jgi:glutamate/tyrosine decarboxylase-like PLP-dependent enzyme
MSEQQSGRRRMELPKKKEDLEKIVEEVEEREHEQYHEHEHVHEHVHEEIEDVVSVLELLVDSLNANYKSLESTVKVHSDEIVRLYKVLAKVVEACGASSEEEKVKALREALSIISAS